MPGPNGGPSLTGQHLFMPGSHPELRKLGQKAIYDFLCERERYILRIKDAQTIGRSIMPNAVKSSVDPDFLLFLFEFSRLRKCDEY